jgi:hypothetical protein
MLVVWQYRDATSHATQQVHDPAQLSALLGVLDQRATADGYPHAVLLSAGSRLTVTWADVGNGGPVHGSLDGGPPPELTLVAGVGDTPVLWRDNFPAARQISVGPRRVSQPEPQDFFSFHADGRQRYAPESSLVSRDAAWQAARLFMISGGSRPATISWRTWVVR